MEYFVSQNQINRSHPKKPFKNRFDRGDNTYERLKKGKKVDR